MLHSTAARVKAIVSHEKKSRKLTKKEINFGLVKIEGHGRRKCFFFSKYQQLKNVFDGWSLWQCDTFEDSWCRPATAGDYGLSDLTVRERREGRGPEGNCTAQPYYTSLHLPQRRETHNNPAH